MRKEALSYFNSPELILLAFFLFLLCFIGIVIWTYRKSGKAYYDKIALIPLKEKHSDGGRHE